MYRDIGAGNHHISANESCSEGRPTFTATLWRSPFPQVLENNLYISIDFCYDTFADVDEATHQGLFLLRSFHSRDTL